MKGVFLFIFALFPSTIVLFFDGMAGHRFWKQFESNLYPFTMGQVTHSEVTADRRRKGTTYGVDIQYSYEVNGHSYDGSRFRYGTFGIFSWTHLSASEAVYARPVGSQTRVYFNRRNPEDAVLSPGVDGRDIILLLFLMPFNFVMVGLWTDLGTSLRWTIFHPVAAGAKIIVEGPRTRIRLPEYRALILGMVATGILSFISFFIVAILTGFQPSIGLAFSVLLLVIAVGVAVYLWQWCEIHSGDNDLVLDESSATVMLPKTFGRKERMQINRGEIKELTVETIVHRNKDGGEVNYSYAATLWIRSSRAGQRLADWSDREEAEAFVEWLRQKLKLQETSSGTDLSAS